MSAGFAIRSAGTRFPISAHFWLFADPAISSRLGVSTQPARFYNEATETQRAATGIASSLLALSRHTLVLADALWRIDPRQPGPPSAAQQGARPWGGTRFPRAGRPPPAHFGASAPTRAA